MPTTNNIRQTLLFFIFLFGACTVSTDNFRNPDNLKTAIANSIKIPFASQDTVVYDSFIGICGNSSKDELNRYYEPHLNEQPYLNILRKNYAGIILYTGDTLYALINSLCKNKPDTVSLWDCFSKNKIRLSVTGEAVTNNSVKIFESYQCNDKHYFIEKLFSYADNKWTHKIIDSKLDNGQ